MSTDRESRPKVAVEKSLQHSELVKNSLKMSVNESVKSANKKKLATPHLNSKSYFWVRSD